MKYKVFNLRQTLTYLGYKILTYNNGYNYRSGFMEDIKGNLFYFSFGDLRDKYPKLLVRTAKDLKDYSGGINTYPELDNIIIKELRKPRYDYNSN